MQLGSESSSSGSGGGGGSNMVILKSGTRRNCPVHNVWGQTCVYRSPWSAASAGARRRTAGAPAQHCTCLLASSLLLLRVFTMGSWIHDGFLDSQWVPSFVIGSWIHDRFLDSRYVPGFTIGT